MAREMIVIMTDDYDHKYGTEEPRPATEIVEIAIDGHLYIIDLCEENNEELRDFLNPYLVCAHEKIKIPKSAFAFKNTKGVSPVPAEVKKPEVKRKVRAHVTSPKVQKKQQDDKIRQWGREHGFKVANRGYIPRKVIQAYAKEEAS